jgi:hypothetical protein
VLKTACRKEVTIKQNKKTTTKELLETYYKGFAENNVG